MHRPICPRRISLSVQTPLPRSTLSALPASRWRTSASGRVRSRFHSIAFMDRARWPSMRSMCGAWVVSGGRRSLLGQLPAAGVGDQTGVAAVGVIDALGLLQRVEIADDKRRRERLARLDRPRAELLDHADVAPLVAPAFADHGRVE